VKYWDASALVPLVVAEHGTEQARSWLRDDPTIITWAWTRVEITSAIERRFREKLITRAVRNSLLARFERLAEQWDEVTDLFAVRQRALRLLARHPLRAADAGQLAAALVVAGEQGVSGLAFVCFDERLGAAAELEGFRVLPETKD